ncbi:MAG TPA: hypothetical protein VEW42_03765 [Candidatus Eisenbacteria bacterium]|nr:hypothetical protein [Candidatus Eisenbacteria bacterium]
MTQLDTVHRFYGVPQPEQQESPPPKKRRKPGPQPPKNGPRPLRMHVDSGGHMVVPYGLQQEKPPRRLRKHGKPRQQRRSRPGRERG